MNPTQILLNQIQTQLKGRSPKLFNQFQQMSGKNPQEILDGMMGKYSPEQKESFINFAKGFGISEEQLSKYGINTK